VKASEKSNKLIEKKLKNDLDEALSKISRNEIEVLNK
jgi:hypothetical protein